MARVTLILGLLLSTVGCDQATKAIARDRLKPGVLTYFGDLLRIQHAENPGAFLSLGAGLPEGARFILLTVVVIVLMAVVLWFLLVKKNLDRWTTVALTLIAAGGVSNLIDRLWRGTVTDFVNLGIGSLRTGIFNVADVAIVAGVLMMVVTLRSPKVAKP